MKKTLFMAMFIFMALSIYAQKKITGRILDDKKQVLEAATVNLKDAEGNTLAYGRTDEKGVFNFTVANNIGNLTIEVGLIGYERRKIEITDSNKFQEIILKPSETNLQTVTVKNRPELILSGDTLTYKTSDFADKQDRNIGEVLKRMPGIEVAENGKISYNGKSISALYIDGDNVLDDKYNVGTKSIPQGAVEKVQIIEKDQPIKMLRKNNMSDDVAINLVMKDDAKLKVMGDAKIGLGLPNKYDGSITAMLFKKQTKFINNIRGNNTGDDPGIDLIAFNGGNYLNKIGNSKPNNLLSSGAAGVPDLPQRRSLLNNAGLINLNNLFKIDKDNQLKFNFAYLYDSRKQLYNKFSETYLPNDTISYTEYQNNRLIPQKLRGQLLYILNSENKYIENTFVSEYTPLKINSLFNLNNSIANQILKQENLNFSNEFNYRKKLKSGNMLNFYSYTQKSAQPETLTISPGLNANILNNNLPYAALNQVIDLPTWYTNNYASTAFVHGHFTHTYRIGHSYQDLNLQSALYKQQNNGTTENAAPNTTNNLNWKNNKTYLDASYEYSAENFKVSVNTPISYNSIQFNDELYFLNDSYKRWFINPLFNLRYQTNIENYLQANYSFKNEIGNIDDVYKGTVLKNYRSLFTNNAPLGESKSHNANLAFNYKKAINMFFFNVQTGYTFRTQNTITSYILNNNIQQRVEIPLINNYKNWIISTSTSKYLFALRTTVRGGFSYSNTKSQNLQNNQLIPFSYNTYNYTAGIQSKFSSFISWSYDGSLTTSFNRSLINENLRTSFSQLRQKSTLSILFLKNIYANLSAEHIHTIQQNQSNLNYLFTDANFKYRIPKINTDIEISITNIGNIKNYEALYISANSYTRGSYQIQGRVFLAKTAFNF